MQITGENLRRVEAAVGDSVAWLKNEIATCPDVITYEAELDALEQEIAIRTKLLQRIHVAVQREGGYHANRT